jgi:formiminoglutamase
MPFYQYADPAIWAGRTDGQEPDLLRWHQVMHYSNLELQSLPRVANQHQGIALLGFCSDEGVRRNGGRPGAAKAPHFLRQACSNLPFIGSHLILADAGDVVCDNEDLEAAQEMLGSRVSQIKQAGYLPIVLGGGHETAWGCFSGIKPTEKNQTFGIIHFDAHFDLRPCTAPGAANSGTGIWQIHDWCRQHRHPFHHLAIGIQQYANTRRLFELADEYGCIYFQADEFTDDQLEHMVTAINGVIANSDVLHLSIDMDVFAACYAPGVSAVAFNGIAPNPMFKRLIRHIVCSGKVACIDLAETNPLFDVDQRTSRLAASIIFDMAQAADANAEFPG